MAEFKKLGSIDTVETVSEETTVLVEQGGEVYRAPMKEIGGGLDGVVVIRAAAPNSGGRSIESTDANGIEYYCNLDFSEILELYNTRKLNFGVMTLFDNTAFSDMIAEFVALDADGNTLTPMNASGATWISVTTLVNQLTLFISENIITTESPFDSGK